MKKESIKLTPAQRQSIEQILSKGKALAWTLKHAQVLLKVDRGPQGPGWSTSQIVEAYCSVKLESILFGHRRNRLESLFVGLLKVLNEV